MFHSNKYRLLKASFRGTHMKVENCGIDLVEHLEEDASAAERAV